MTQEIRSRIVGIVNLTPDSFSDGGRLTDTHAALEHMATLLADGADVLDIGAESTRPGATPLPHEEEWKRLADVVREARARFPDAVFSIDTRHAATAEKALELGVDWINDVSAGADPAMVGVIRDHGDCKYVVMHSLSVPADPSQLLPEGVDMRVMLESWGRRRIRELKEQGITKDRLVLDPGLGFGKTARHSWHILRDMPALQKSLSPPWLVGHSRKSFFGPTATGKAEERDLETHIVSSYLARHGTAYLRVHDVAGTRRAIAISKKLALAEEQR